jgi:hypothetical protein
MPKPNLLKRVGKQVAIGALCLGLAASGPSCSTHRPTYNQNHNVSCTGTYHTINKTPVKAIGKTKINKH